jgi:hypothetical protein
LEAGVGLVRPIFRVGAVDFSGAIRDGVQGLVWKRAVWIDKRTADSPSLCFKRREVDPRLEARIEPLEDAPGVVSGDAKELMHFVGSGHTLTRHGWYPLPASWFSSSSLTDRRGSTSVVAAFPLEVLHDPVRCQQFLDAVA